MLFQYLLKTIIHQGSLVLVTAKKRRTTFGNDRPPRATIKLHKKSLEWTLGIDPELGIGEAYRNGSLTIKEGTLRDFLQILLLNVANLEKTAWFRWLDRFSRPWRRFKQVNPLNRARKNATHHYDLSPQLYDLFLDSDRQYSCGYFVGPRVSLDQAQLDKKRHIASKLYLNQPNLKVLDIGSGWGGLALFLAQEANCDVTGLTLSNEQFVQSEQRAQAKKLSKKCRFALRDYRQEKGPYDRIVSVGMFEHVGKKHYDEFFRKIHDLLAHNGVCLLHAIGRFNESRAINPFIRKHIFPGADLPSLSEVLLSVERSGLFATDVEILRLHYAETLRHWNERFQKHRTEAARIYDESFCRKWEFYLIGCELAFRLGQLMVFQLQLTKRLTTLPITRDYMFEWESLQQDLPLPSIKTHIFPAKPRQRA
jgi:cyclopropane-fatty-acyl-phospholipid synthase